MTNNDPQYDLELNQMETYAQFLDTLASAAEAFQKITDAATYLNFNKEEMIQQYYDSLTGFCLGMNSLKEGFYNYAGSFNIDLEENIQD